MPMYILGANNRPEKLPNEPHSIYENILTALDEYLRHKDNPYQDYIKHIHNIFSVNKQNCINKIERRSHHGSASIRSFLFAEKYHYKLKKNYLEWGLHIASRIYSKRNLDLELLLAQKVQHNHHIKNNLNSSCRLIHQFCLEHYPKILTSAYDGFDTYNFYSMPFTVAQILSNPTKFNINYCVAALHAVTQNIYHFAPDKLYLPLEKQLATDKDKHSVPYNRDNLLEKFECSRWQNINGEITLINEFSPAIIGPSMHGMPTCLPSLTTARMLKLLSLSGGCLVEKQALAYCLFSFWQYRYNKNISGVHHYHAVMDMAANFDVPYEAFTYQNIISDLGLDESLMIDQSRRCTSGFNRVCEILAYYGDILRFIIVLPLYLFNIAIHLELHIKDCLFTCFIAVVATLYKPAFEIDLEPLDFAI